MAKPVTVGPDPVPEEQDDVSGAMNVAAQLKMMADELTNSPEGKMVKEINAYVKEQRMSVVEMLEAINEAPDYPEGEEPQVDTLDKTPQLISGAGEGIMEEPGMVGDGSGI